MPFIISWKLGAAKVFHVTRDEWIQGMKTLKYRVLSGTLSYCRADTLAKMKDALPSLEMYASSSCAEEIFSRIYHWAFIYMKENEMRKVIDLDVSTSPKAELTCRSQLLYYKCSLQIGRIGMLDHSLNFSKNRNHKDV